MKKSSDKTSRKLLLALNEPFALTERPFRAVADKCGMREAGILTAIRRLKTRGIIRRLGVQLSHQELGLKCNVLVAWSVPKGQLAQSGQALAAFDEVSHCYARRTYPQWPYNLYTMVHGRDRAGCLRIIRRMARAAGCQDYTPLFTVREFKKIKSDLAGILR